MICLLKGIKRKSARQQRIKSLYELKILALLEKYARSLSDTLDDDCWLGKGEIQLPDCTIKLHQWKFLVERRIDLGPMYFH